MTNKENIIGAGGTSLVEAVKADPELKEQLEQAIIESTEDVEIGLPQMEVIHSQAKFADPRTGQLIERFEGIIIDTHLTNAYWHDSNGADSYPDCISYDGKNPHETSKDVQANSCAICPKNSFGSGKGGSGKACKNTRRLAVLFGNGEDALIVRLTLTPSMLKGYKKYVQNLVVSNQAIFSVLTEFSLRKEIQGDRNWSIVEMRAKRSLTMEEFKALTQLRKEAKESRVDKFEPTEEYPQTETQDEQEVENE